MADEATTFWFIPSLVAVLHRAEQDAGRPLTEEEVLNIRDNANVVAAPIDIIPKLESERGYKDIDPENCWSEWQAMRTQLKSST